MARLAARPQALEEMRKMRNAMVAEVKALRANLAHVGTVLDQAVALREAKARGEEERATLQARADEAVRAIEATEAEHRGAVEALGRVQSLEGRRDALDAQAATLLQSNANTEERLRVCARLMRVLMVGLQCVVLLCSIAPLPPLPSPSIRLRT